MDGGWLFVWLSGLMDLLIDCVCLFDRMIG